MEADEIAKPRRQRMIRIATTAAGPATGSTLPEDVSALTWVKLGKLCTEPCWPYKAQNFTAHTDGGRHRTADNCALWSSPTASQKPGILVNTPRPQQKPASGRIKAT